MIRKLAGVVTMPVLIVFAATGFLFRLMRYGWSIGDALAQGVWDDDVAKLWSDL